MSETYRQIQGRKVVSRASAHELGSASDLLFDVREGSVTGLVVGSGRKARIVDWANVSGFGPDAVMVGDDADAREPVGEREEKACSGKLGLVGSRVLSEKGNELGTFDDIVFDPADGRVLGLVVGDREMPAGALLGAGSYAAVVSADQDPSA